MELTPNLVQPKVVMWEKFLHKLSEHSFCWIFESLQVKSFVNGRQVSDYCKVISKGEPEQVVLCGKVCFWIKEHENVKNRRSKADIFLKIRMIGK